jgi:hypothetical protein
MLLACAASANTRHETRNVKMSIDLGLSDRFTPFIKYNAKAGRWTVRRDDNEVEIVNPRFAIDFDGIETGWLNYPKGDAPKRVFDLPNGGERQPKPAPIGSIDFKRGFVVHVFASEPRDELGGDPLGLREFSSTALAVRKPINRAYEEYLRERLNNPGKIPIFRCDGTNVIKGKAGDSFEPRLVLEGWVERLLEFEGDGGGPVTQAPPAAAVDDRRDDYPV